VFFSQHLVRSLFDLDLISIGSQVITVLGVKLVPCAHFSCNPHISPKEVVLNRKIPKDLGGFYFL
jgi:hypothetical protein